jgi:hypothetical protein
MGQIYLAITLPNIPKIVDTSYINQDTSLKNNVVTAWCEKIGFAIINCIEFEVGGKIVDKLYGDWFNIWYELTIRYDKRGFNEMIGNNYKNRNLVNGHGSYMLHVPLPLYFCKYNGLALPLIALNYSDIKINESSECIAIGNGLNNTIDGNFIVSCFPYGIHLQSSNNNKMPAAKMKKENIG